MSGSYDSANRQRVSVGMKPSVYAADLTVGTAGTAVTQALASGVKLGAGRVMFVCQAATTEAVKIAFGTDATDATTNLGISGSVGTTGIHMGSGADGYETTLIFEVPDDATYIAMVNATASDTPTVSVVQGV